MKKYFTKLKPLRGEINYNDYFTSPDGKLHRCKDVLESLPATIQSYDNEIWKKDEVTKVILMLCSRDLKVGDTFHTFINSSMANGIIEADLGDSWQVESSFSGIRVLKSEAFKIIGEISTEAIYGLQMKQKI